MLDNTAGLILEIIFKAVWFMFKAAWLFWLLLFAVWLFVTLYPSIKEKALKEKKFSAINSMKSDREILNSLRRLKPSEFEEYVANLYSKLGYSAERVGGAYDQGIDVIIEKDGVRQYIQCKKFITRKVAVGDVRDFFGAISAKPGSGNGILITTNIFTTEAKKFAEENMIEIIDGRSLVRLSVLAGVDTTIKNTREVLSSDKRSCPECGANLVLREGKYGEFYGCSRFPKCRFTRK